MKKQTIYIAEVYWQIGEYYNVVWSTAFKDKNDALASAKSFRRKHDWAKDTQIIVYALTLN